MKKINRLFLEDNFRLIFFRERRLQILVSEKPVLIKLAVGFTNKIDPISGLSINLTHIDNWLNELDLNTKAQSFQNEEKFLKFAFQFFKNKNNCQLVSLEQDLRRIQFDGSVFTYISNSQKIENGKIINFETTYIKLLDAKQKNADLNQMKIISIKKTDPLTNESIFSIPVNNQG